MRHVPGCLFGACVSGVWRYVFEGLISRVPDILAQVFAEQLILYTGTDVIDPPLIFPIGEDVTAEFSWWSEVYELCGSSRVWGGMHFYVSHLHRFIHQSVSTCQLAQNESTMPDTVIPFSTALVAYTACSALILPMRFCL